MLLQVVQEPLFVPKLMQHVGLMPLADWLGHVGMLGAYSLAYRLSPPLQMLASSLPPAQAFALRRAIESWEYGSGADYKL